MQGDYTAARTLFANSLALYGQLGQARGVAEAQGNLAGPPFGRVTFPPRAPSSKRVWRGMPSKPIRRASPTGSSPWACCPATGRV